MSNSKDVDTFRHLSNAIFNGDVLGIHSWFKDTGFEANSVLSKNLCNYIVNTPFFFSFSSNLLDKEVLDKELLRRQLPVISYFNLKEQLSIISSLAIDNQSFEHFKVLKYSKKDKNLILKDKNISLLFTDFFNKEKFDLIKSIEDLLSLDIKSNRHNFLGINYRSIGNGCFYLIEKAYNTCALDDIIFNYTKNKSIYLKEIGRELPNFEYVNNIKRLSLQEVSESDYFRHGDYKQIIEDKIENYLINYRYELISDSLPSKHISIKVVKKI